MYLCVKFHQLVQKITHEKVMQTQTLMPTRFATNYIFGRHNQDQDKHSGSPTLGPNCFIGNKQTAKSSQKSKTLTYHIILRGSKFWTVLNGPCCDDLRHVVHSNFLRHSLTKSHQAKVDVRLINRHLRSLKLEATTMF